MSRPSKTLVNAIKAHPEDPRPHLVTLRMIVAERLDATESARETASLARVILDVEAALRALTGADGPRSSVDELLARRTARGAR